jgi:DNA polymerase-1
VLVLTDQQFNSAVSTLGNYEDWTVDCETNGLDAYSYHQLCGIGVAVPDHTFYFPFRHQSLGSNLDPKYLSPLFEELNKIKRVVAYNLKFDVPFLEKEGFDTGGKQLIDVIVMARLTESSSVNTLSLTETISRRFGPNNAAYDKETKQILVKNKWNRDFSMCPSEILGPYCEKDAYWTLKVYEDSLAKIKKSNQEGVWRTQIDLTRVLLDMERQGIQIDQRYASEVLNKLSVRSGDIQDRIESLAGQVFNISSPQQVGTYFNSVGIHSPMKTASGAEAWNEGALVQVNHPVAGLIRQHRTLAKLKSTYIQPYIETSVMHTTFANWGTVTGRLSSRSPNLQNIPRNHFKLYDMDFTPKELLDVRERVGATIASKGGSASDSEKLSDEVIKSWGFMGDESLDETNSGQVSIRRLFVPRPDHFLVSYDYSQMEVRMFMYYINNPEMLELMRLGDIDFHGEAAKLAFKVDEDSPDFKFYRQLAKTITFGVIYGIGKDKLAQQLKTTPNEAAKYKKEYFANIDGSKKFFDTVVRMIEHRGWVQNKFGRVYKVPSDKGYKAVNYLIQGTSADLLSERMIAVSEYLEDKKSIMLLQVHDEIICEIHKDEASEVVPAIKELLEENSLNIPLHVDLEICDPSWATKRDFVLTELLEPDIISNYIDWD